MSLRSVNLNLLPILASLLHERNVSRAAAAVGMSQPAASRSLAQLRAILDDPLLVPSGTGLVRTPRADGLVDTVDRLCRELDAFWQPEEFDPRALKREFVLASSDYAPMIMVPRISPPLQVQAPGVSLRFTDLVPSSNIAVPLGVDFVVVPQDALRGHLANGGSFAPLFSDEFVPVVAATHPFAGRAFDPEEIDEFPHIVFSANETLGSSAGSVDLLGGRRPARTLAFVRHFGALPHLVISTQAVAITPRRLAEAMIDDGLPIVILSEPKPRATVDLCLAWTARFNGDPAHRWFRELVVASLGAPCRRTLDRQL